MKGLLICDQGLERRLHDFDLGVGRSANLGVSKDCKNCLYVMIGYGLFSCWRFWLK